jgi:hypothetical protein
MKLHEALSQGSAQKHVDRPIAGTHTVSKANISAGYYADFRADDPARRSPFSTSFYWGPDELASITAYAGTDNWEPR